MTRAGHGSDLSALSPIGRETLQEQAYGKLKEALMSGRFTPGQNITLRATAAALGTSPMPVRDALRRLETERALVARPNRTLGVPEMTCDSLVELCEVRMALEGLAAEKAARTITLPELAQVDALYKAMAQAAESGDLVAYTRVNWAFHAEIYRASRSELLVSLIEPIWMRVGPYVHLMMPDRKSLIVSLPNHRRAREALRRHDPVLAREAIMNDIHESADGLAQALAAAAGMPGQMEKKPSRNPSPAALALAEQTEESGRRSGPVRRPGRSR